MTNANAELAMRVKALEVDVAALQRKLAEVIEVAERTAEDLRTLDARTRKAW